MTISIKINNPYLMNRAHNYFYNKNVQTMLCNNETELTLFNLEQTEAELLLKAFTKHFHLKPAMQHPLAAWAKKIGHNEKKWTRFWIFSWMFPY